MNKKLLLVALSIIGLIGVVSAQTADVKYRRSSLHTMLVETEEFAQKATIVKAFSAAPFPDKYNDHSLAEKTFDPKKYPLAAEETTKENGKEMSESKQIPLQINKYLKDNKVANKMVAKWFNRQADGSFDMNLISERGSYDATQMAANIAKGSARGVSSLSDAGIELIGNTFIVVSKFNFVSNEVVAAGVREAAKVAATNLSVAALQQAAIKAADAVYEKTKEGYSVWATAFLYKLTWNDSIEAVFYQDLWMDKTVLDPKKKEAFDKSDLFGLEFVGDEKASTLVTFSMGEKKTEDQIIEKATIRTVDAVYAKLQKKYDVFKPKVPLLTGVPITAKIGMKEGLEGGEKFEVLEQVIDPATGKTSYNSKGTITVDKKLIWDNRYNAADEVVTAPVDGTPVVEATTFSGGKKFYPGMLIKQVK